MNLLFGYRRGAAVARLLAAAAVSAVVLTSMSGQSAPAGGKSPKEVLELYRKVDSAGGRLTPSGWREAADFFVRPSLPPQDMAMTVMTGERVTGVKVTDNRAELWILFSGEGRIDSRGRFTRTIAPGLNGPAAIEQQYFLILTETHWELGASREAPRQVKGPLEWRIETFESEPRITVEAAIHYLRELRDSATDPQVKRNADHSIATLKHLH